TWPGCEVCQRELIDSEHRRGVVIAIGQRLGDDGEYRPRGSREPSSPGMMALPSIRTEACPPGVLRLGSVPSCQGTWTGGGLRSARSSTAGDRKLRSRWDF